MNIFQWIPNILLMGLIVICPYLEHKRGAIPFWVPLAFGVAGLGMKCFGASPLEQLKETAVVLGILLLVFLLPLLKNVIDRGDFLVIAAVGVIKGLMFTLFCLFALALVSGTLAFLTLIWKGGWGKNFSLVSQGVKNMFRKKENRVASTNKQHDTVPFAISCALSVLWVWIILTFA